MCGEQCILGKRQDNGANHASDCRMKVNKTPTKNKKNTYVINDLIVHVILCGPGNRKKGNTFLFVMRSLLPRHPKFVDTFSQN
jgi:hypothetical protein